MKRYRSLIPQMTSVEDRKNYKDIIITTNVDKNDYQMFDRDKETKCEDYNIKINFDFKRKINIKKISFCGEVFSKYNDNDWSKILGSNDAVKWDELQPFPRGKREIDLEVDWNYRYIEIECKWCYSGYINEIEIYDEIPDCNYLFKYKKKYFTLLENNQIKEVDMDFKNGFNDFTLINFKELKKTFDNINDLQLLIMPNEHKEDMQIICNSIPYRPIDKLKQIGDGKFDIVMKEV